MEMMKEYIDEAEKALLHTYNRYQIVFEKGNQTVMGQAGSQEKEEKQAWAWAGRGLTTVWMGWSPT